METRRGRDPGAQPRRPAHPRLPLQRIRQKPLRGSAAGVSIRAAATGVGVIAMPYLSRAADRPLVTHGVQSGDVGADGGVVSRADRRAQMLVEVADRANPSPTPRTLPPIARTAGKRLHREDAAGKPARRAGHLLPRPLPRPRASRHLERAGGRPLPHRAGRSAATSASSGAATTPARAGASTRTMAA